MSHLLTRGVSSLARSSKLTSALLSISWSVACAAPHAPDGQEAAEQVASTELALDHEPIHCSDTIAEAHWLVPYPSSGGSVQDGWLAVRLHRQHDTTYPIVDSFAVTFWAPGSPPVRLWTRGSATWPFTPGSLDFGPDLEGATLAGSGGTPEVTFNVEFTGTEWLEISEDYWNIYKKRAATAVAQVSYDGDVLVDGPANHPSKPAPFISYEWGR